MEGKSVTLRDMIGTKIPEIFSLYGKKVTTESSPPPSKQQAKAPSQEKPKEKKDKPKAIIEYVVIEMELLFDFRNGYDDAKPFEGISGMLEDLSNNGYSPLYVASREGIEADNNRLKKCGLDKYFKFIGKPESEIVSLINTYNTAFLCSSVSSAGSMAFHGGAVIGATWNKDPLKHQDLANAFRRAKIYNIVSSPQEIKEIMSHMIGRSPTCLPMQIFDLFPD
jgi:hypothetical protein